MSVRVKGVVWDLGMGLKLQCATPYALIDEQTGQTLYALTASGTRLEALVDRKVEVIGEQTGAYPQAEYEVLDVEEIRQL